MLLRNINGDNFGNYDARNMDDDALKKYAYLSFTYIHTYIQTNKHTLLLLLRSNPSKQHAKVLYHWGSGEKERQAIKEK